MDLISPVPLAIEDRPYKTELHEALVRELFLRSKAALVLLILTLVLVWKLMGATVENHPALPWFYLMLSVIAALRLISILVMDQRPKQLASAESRYAVFILGSTLSGLAFATINWLMVPQLDSTQVFLLCLILTGINSVAVQSMAGSPVAFALYMLPNMGSFTLMVWRGAPTPHQDIFLLLLCLYIVALMVMSMHTHTTFRRSILQGIKLGDLALRDSLTGLRNRRFLMEFMETEVLRIQRTWSVTYHGSMRPASSIALIIVDIDFFKYVNDTHGHEAGDEVLRQFSILLRDTVRQPDLVTRWGGEEFVIVAVDTVRSPQQPLTERVRKAVEAHEFRLPNGQSIRRTCSVGYAYFPFFELDPEGMAWDQVLNLADGALYLAKQEGRNRVCGVVPGPSLAEAPRALITVGKDLHEPMKAGLVGVVRRAAGGA